MIRIQRLCVCLLLAALPLAAQESQTPPPPSPPPAGTVIETPFGRVQAPGAPAASPEPEPPQAVPVDPAPEPPPGALAAQPVPSQDAGVPAQDGASPIQLQLDNADIYQVIRIIGDALGLNYIIDPRVQGTVNISTSGSLQRSDLLPILETILKINGATMIQTGNFYQIVPASAAVQQPLAVQDSRAEVSLDDQIVLQVVRMRYMPASEMATLLMPYLGEGGNIVVHAAGNILLVAERRSNLRKLLEIVDVFDSDVFENERVRLYPVENALAGDLIRDLESIFRGYAFSETSAIQFVPIDRLNSIMVVTPNSAVFDQVGDWIRRLDQPLQSSGIRNFVYKVRNSRAADIHRVLSQLYGDEPVAAPVLPPAPPTPGLPAPPDAAGRAPAPAASVRATASGQNIRIIADEVNNSLIVQATPQVYAEIERTILELDILPRQVLIDAQIYEVSLDDSLSLGISAALQNRDPSVGRSTTAAFAAPENGGPPSLSVETFAFLGRTRELVAFINAAENRSRVRTLSAPSVLVSDNMTAQFQVGAEVPVPTSSSVTPVQSDGTNLFAQTIQFRTTGVLLNVRPQINDSGRVTLEIAQEVSQAGANTTSAIVAPVIGKSSVTSTIVVQDGQTIALGGFIRENQELARSRVPLVGRVPVLGLLFGNTRQATTRSELLILITPHVIRDTDESRQATEELKNKLRQVQRLLQ